MSEHRSIKRRVVIVRARSIEKVLDPAWFGENVSDDVSIDDVYDLLADDYLGLLEELSATHKDEDVTVPQLMRRLFDVRIADQLVRVPVVSVDA